MTYDGDGFGFVPVPLYTQSFNWGDPNNYYNTVVHNLARVFSISKSTINFEKCTRFLEEVSTSSADVVDMYRDDLVTTLDSFTSSLNMDMFNFIKNHANTAFDKTYEDIISNYQGVTDYNSSTKNWHGIFKANGYIVTNMTQRYQEESPAKQAQLEIVLDEWAKLS